MLPEVNASYFKNFFFFFFYYKNTKWLIKCFFAVFLPEIQSIWNLSSRVTARNVCPGMRMVGIDSLLITSHGFLSRGLKSEDLSRLSLEKKTSILQNIYWILLFLNMKSMYNATEHIFKLLCYADLLTSLQSHDFVNSEWCHLICF